MQPPVRGGQRRRAMRLLMLAPELHRNSLPRFGFLGAICVGGWGCGTPLLGLAMPGRVCPAASWALAPPSQGLLAGALPNPFQSSWMREPRVFKKLTSACLLGGRQREHPSPR